MAFIYRALLSKLRNRSIEIDDAELLLGCENVLGALYEDWAICIEKYQSRRNIEHTLIRTIKSLRDEAAQKKDGGLVLDGAEDVRGIASTEAATETFEEEADL
jgi:hypothetical protein